MRYIIIPPKQVMDSIINNETKQPVRWGIHDMLREVCWGAQEWRQNETNLKAFERCYSAFDGKKEGEIVELEGADYEIFMPIATMKGKNIPPAHAIQLNRLMIPIMCASNEQPKSEGEANAGNNGQNESSTVGAAANGS
jgi:hypothetical protein